MEEGTEGAFLKDIELEGWKPPVDEPQSGELVIEPPGTVAGKVIDMSDFKAAFNKFVKDYPADAGFMPLNTMVNFKYDQQNRLILAYDRRTKRLLYPRDVALVISNPIKLGMAHLVQYIADIYKTWQQQGEAPGQMGLKDSSVFLDKNHRLGAMVESWLEGDKIIAEVKALDLKKGLTDSGKARIEIAAKNLRLPIGHPDRITGEDFKRIVKELATSQVKKRGVPITKRSMSKEDYYKYEALMSKVVKSKKKKPSTKKVKKS